MPIHFPAPPNEFRKVITDGLFEGVQIYKANVAKHPIRAEVSVDRIEMPVQIFSIPVSALKSGSDLSSVVSEGWRVFLQVMPPVRVAEACRVGPDGQTVFTGISSGPQITSLRSLLERLSDAPEFQAVDVDARLLRVKPLHFAALWLSSSDPASDLFFTLSPSHPPFEQGARYGLEEVTDLLRKAADAAVPNLKVFVAR